MNFETAWSRFTRVTLFLGGLCAFWYEIVFENSDRIWILAGAMGMMGVPLARGLESVLTKASSPPPPEPMSAPAPAPAKTPEQNSEVTGQ